MPRLVFMTRGAVQAGQELTYDYRFKEEAGDNKMHCRCGAPNCRGSLN
jgi:SET domain-containing protein